MSTLLIAVAGALLVGPICFLVGWDIGDNAGSERWWASVLRLNDEVNELLQLVMDEAAPEHEDGGGI